ncbi:aldehyde dehydrogenase [Anaerosacchariphilus polymeriproducens]|uniref:Aldehyde dehydrogenase n=1 Tax=Anaerosacchariphilus polymeriproducens TaxID=1812858 RepID=A0A371AWI1_9FIRM|nr:aldehyde dehydrogenase [Anaerosacchariphilus polymeriproducens]RDU23927.1 aldehyde dehydrogenase [Anaerosacchariphilus polymeriproducens]
MEKILEKQNQFFQSQKTKDISFRIRQLKRLKREIIRRESKIKQALYEDLGKPEFESYMTEIYTSILEIQDMIHHLEKWAKCKEVSTPLILAFGKSEIRYEPLGSVLIMVPFNFPFLLAISPLVGAIGAGNCVVLKPSEHASKTQKVLEQLIKALYPPNYIEIKTGGIETAQELLKLPFDHIFFTGSSRVGKIVMEAAAKNLTPVTLELGGKSPVIVEKTADIKSAAKRIAFGKFLNAGQICVAPDYVYVQKSIKKQFVKELKKAIQEFYGQKAVNSKSFGRIINKEYWDRINIILEKDREYIIYGGNSNRKHCFIEPTLLDIPSWSAECMQEELFAPLLPILTFQSIEEVIENINRKEKPLALYLFTQNKKVKEKVLSETSSGGVCINDTILHLMNANLPFGGVGHSGMGSYHGIQSFRTFSHAKSVYCRMNKCCLSMLLPPYNNSILNILQLLF